MKKVLMGLVTVLMLCFGSSRTFGQESIHFEEEEDMVFKPQLLEFLGVEKVIVAAGKYEIKFDEKNPNGFVEFEIKDYQGSSNHVYSLKPGGIRIAVRKPRDCGSGRLRSCLCGVGFRCGTTTTKMFDDGEEVGEEASIEYDEKNTDPRVVSTEIEINAETNKVIFRFTKKVDWSKIID